MQVNESVISKLFYVMRTMYGSKWIIIFISPEKIEAGKVEWLAKLKSYSAMDIKKTLDHVKEIHPVSPPDIGQFVKLLKHLKGSRPGHLSNKVWQSKEMEKTNKTGFRDKIKQEYGI